VAKKHLLFILLLLFVSSCSSVKNNKIFPLTKKDTAIIDSWAKSNVIECRFLYEKKLTTKKITANKVNKCLDSFSDSIHHHLQFHYNEPKKSKFFNEKLYDQFIDYYLYDKLFVYVNSLSLPELTIIFQQLTDSMYAANPKFLKLLISKGVPTRKVVYIIHHISEEETCKAEMLILNNNIHLYRNEKYLNKRQFRGVKPKDKIFYQLADMPSNSHCRDVVELLIKTNPNLKNIRTELGDTPLHFFMEGFGNRYKTPVTLAKKIITSKNINAQNNYGKTPLHVLLDSLRNTCSYVVRNNKDKNKLKKCTPMGVNLYPSKKIIKMTNVLLKSGAKIDIKDKKGITPRNLMMTHLKLINMINNKGQP